jgi:hypothetical protein
MNINSHLDKNQYKINKKKSWKQKKILFNDNEDFDYWFNRYFNSTKCEICSKEYPNTIDRCLDHNHNDGKPRNILCKCCNLRKFDRKHYRNLLNNRYIYYDPNKDIYIFDKRNKNIRVLKYSKNLKRLNWIKFSILLLNKKFYFT